MFTEVDSVDEAVELANASTYSLASAVWTKDIHVAFDITSRIRAGTIFRCFVSTCDTSKYHLLLPRYLQHQRPILPPRVTVRTRRSRVSRSTFMQKIWMLTILLLVAQVATVASTWKTSPTTVLLSSTPRDPSLTLSLVPSKKFLSVLPTCISLSLCVLQKNVS